MDIGFFFILNSIALGIGLAMDAFSVSLANGLAEPGMRKSKFFSISLVFAFFQALMPLIGWFFVHTFVEYFTSFQKYIPFIALALLVYIGISMIVESFKCKEDSECDEKLTLPTLLLQGVATSIDALSVGFTIADYKWYAALISAVIISVVTFIICTAGLYIGRKFGTKFSSKATVFGGIILILIGLEIFITGII